MTPVARPGHNDSVAAREVMPSSARPKRQRWRCGIWSAIFDAHRHMRAHPVRATKSTLPFRFDQPGRWAPPNEQEMRYNCQVWLSRAEPYGKCLNMSGDNKIPTKADVVRIVREHMAGAFPKTCRIWATDRPTRVGRR